MSEKHTERIVLTTVQMKQIARYELTFKELIEKSVFEDIDVICPESYQYTLEDLTIAIRNLKEKDPTIYDFGEYWFYPLQNLEDAFGLDRARGYLEDVDDRPKDLKLYRNLPVSDSYWFDDVWCQLDDAWSYAEDEEDKLQLSRMLGPDTILESLARYESNKGKPILEWEFTKQEKKNYIRSFGEDERVNKAAEKELILARRMIDELCAEDSGLALHIKGYACYGGNRLYDCDWPTSRDCMIRLFEKKGDPNYANTLGYIFYYGRCTGGLPEYEKAFHYFGIAAANGLYEGLYKLADMFRHGYGCEKSPRTAHALYGMVYEDSIKSFLKGDHANFADAALRMGNVYAKGIDERVNAENAYIYYLQADYAAKIRAKTSDFFGNTTVVMNIQKALDEIRPKLPEDYFREYRDYDAPVYLMELARYNNRCTLTRTAKDDGTLELAGERFATKACPAPDQILVTIGPLNFCRRTGKFSMTAVNASGLWFADDAGTVKYDYCTYNDVDDRYEFYYDDDLTAWIKCDTFRIYGPAASPKEGKEYRLASVKFSANGRTYDYLCDGLDVQIGDTVVVNGYDGEAEVSVVCVYTKYESELSIPVERFKKIVRKI